MCEQYEVEPSAAEMLQWKVRIKMCARCNRRANVHVNLILWPEF